MRGAAAVAAGGPKGKRGNARLLHRVAVDAAVPEFLLVQDELDNRAMVSQLLAALESGGAVGEVGDINTATVDVTALDRYVEAAQIPLPFPFWHGGGCPLLR